MQGFPALQRRQGQAAAACFILVALDLFWSMWQSFCCHAGVDAAQHLPQEETLVQLLSELPQAFAEEQGLTLAEAEQRCLQAARDVNVLIGEGCVSTNAMTWADLHVTGSMQI